MPTRTAHVTGVEPHPRFPQRFNVYLLGFGALPIYTLNAWHAALCERACAIRHPITAATRQTRYGEEIVDVALAGDVPKDAA